MNTQKRRARKKKFPVSFTCYLTAEQSGQLSAVSDRLNMSLAEVVRDLVDNDLPKLVERHKKRLSRGTQSKKLNDSLASSDF